MGCYKPHQIEKSDQLYDLVKRKRVALVAGQTRTGKTRVAIRTAEISAAGSILVVTKKAAINGWLKELGEVDAKKDYHVTNYEQVKNLDGDYDLIIVDESHNIGRPGKPSKRFQQLREITYTKRLILMTATPSTETLLAFYYQFALSKWSPFAKFKRFTDFFKVYGIPNLIRRQTFYVETYTKGKPEIYNKIKPHLITITQKEAGITHKAEDKLHVVSLQPSTVELLKSIRKNHMVTIGSVTHALESESAERVLLHQIETGSIIHNNHVVHFPHNEVIEYILRRFGDKPTNALMAHYIATRERLKLWLPASHIYSANAHAEGVDLSHYDNLIIVNSDFSGAKFVQRRERIVNMNRDKPAVVHHIVTNGGISRGVYDAVSKKRNYTLRLYRNG